tara:strand:- start:648 stop:848 length:201 start_codon:yes stop_codon:yes gene_type:complete
MTKSNRKNILSKIESVQNSLDSCIKKLYEIDAIFGEDYPDQKDAISRMVIVISASSEVVSQNKSVF